MRRAGDSFEWPAGGNAEVAGQVFVGVLGQDEPGGAEHRGGVFSRRGKDVDGVLLRAVGNDEPFVVSEDDLRPPDGTPGRPARRCGRRGPGPGGTAWAATAREGGGGLGDEGGR